jgi:circadian clock protein KaiB
MKSGQKKKTRQLRLYIAGQAQNSLMAIANLNKILVQWPEADCNVEIVDVLTDPRRALADRVLVTPVLIRVSPQPELRLIGNLSETEKVAQTLGK